MALPTLVVQGLKVIMATNVDQILGQMIELSIRVPRDGSVLERSDLESRLGVHRKVARPVDDHQRVRTYKSKPFHIIKATTAHLQVIDMNRVSSRVLREFCPYDIQCFNLVFEWFAVPLAHDRKHGRDIHHERDLVVVMR